MTSSYDDHEEEPGSDQQEPFPERPQRQQRPRRTRPEPNPALDPRLVQLERRSQRSRTGDFSLFIFGIVAFMFGVGMHYWVVTAVLDDGEAAESSNVPEATATPDAGAADAATATPAGSAPPTATPLPDRTSCDEIRGTQYRSVTEREFFLANCTGQQAPAPTQAAPEPTQAAPEPTQTEAQPTQPSQ